MYEQSCTWPRVYRTGASTRDGIRSDNICFEVKTVERQSHFGALVF